MASVITPTGKKIEYKPKNGKTFTIFEISEYLDGIVEPAFIANSWIFFNKNGAYLKMQFNQPASAMLGFNIYGLCLIADEKELPCQFFLADNDSDNDSDKMIEDFENISNDESDKILGKINNMSDEEEQKHKEFINSVAYKFLIEKNIPYSSLLKEFVIFENDVKRIEIVYKRERISLLEQIIEFYSNLEEYEKCIELSKLKLYIEENQKDD